MKNQIKIRYKWEYHVKKLISNIGIWAKEVDKEK